MYKPLYSAQTNKDSLHSFIDENSFGTVICRGVHPALEITHIPFLLDKSTGMNGTLLSHVARSNPISKSLASSDEVVVIFQGPHGYISPSWYSSRAEVPTWNYSVVHAYGRPRLLHDAELIKQLERLVDKYEHENRNRWRISELKASFFDQLRKEIVGFAIEIIRLEGKFKLSQNRNLEDRQGVIEGIVKRGNPLDSELAAMMKKALSNDYEK